MKSATRLFLPALAAALCFVTITLIHRPVAASQAADEAAVRAVVERFVAAYQKEDLVSLMGFWNRRSQDMIPTLEKLFETFAEEDYAFTNLVVTDIKIASNRAILRVSANLSITRSETKEVRQERFARNLALTKENDEWRIFYFSPETQSVESFLRKGAEWRTSNTLPVAEQFVSALLNLNERDREAMLAENPEAVTVELRKELLKRADSLARISATRNVFDLYRLTLKVAERINDKEGAALTHLGLAKAFTAANDPSQALASFQKALALFEELGDKKQQAATLEELGTLHLRQMEGDKALVSYNRALSIYEGLNYPLGVANAYEEIGSVYYEQKKFEAAIVEFEKALKIRELLGRKPEVAATHNNIGNAYYYLEQFDTAIEHYGKAISGFELNNDKLAIAETLNNTGGAHYSLGDYDAALDAYQKSLKVAKEIGYKPSEATSLLGAGLVHYARGDYALALDDYSKNLALLEFLRDRNGVPGTLHKIGLVYLRQQNLALALAAYLKALPLYEALGDRDSKLEAAALLIEIGGIHFEQGDHEAAMGRYRAALAAYQGLAQDLGVAAAQNAIGSVHAAQKLYDPALEAFHKSLSEYDRYGEKERVGDVLINIAGAHYSRGDYQQTLKTAEQATALARQVNNAHLLWQSRYVAGSAHRALSQLEEARKAFEESIATVEVMRGELIDDEQAPAFYRDKSAPYLAMMEWLLVNNRAAEAFAYAETVRSQKLWDLLRGVRLRINRTMSVQEQEQQYRLSRALVSVKRQHDREKARKTRDERKLAGLAARLQKTRVDYEAFKTRLYAMRPQVKVWRGESPPFRAEEAARLLDTKTALLEFVGGDSQSYLFVITRDAGTAGARPSLAAVPTQTVNLKAYILNVNRADLADRAAKFRDAVRKQQADTATLGRELFDVLLRPALAQLTGKDALVIVPDSMLWELPFQALQTAENRYLIEDFAVRYATSFSSLREAPKPRAATTTPQAPRPATQLLAFGNPVISKEVAARLKLSGREVRTEARDEVEIAARALSQLYGESQSRAYLGAEASEERCKSEAGTSRVLHLAAPVLLSDAAPFYSFALLSQTVEDGLLQAWEAISLDLRAETVVLTAAEAGETGIGEGNGLAGFAWSLYVAGSQSLVVNQWRAAAEDDEVVIEFHRHLKQGLAPALAFRQATLKLLKGEKSHPFYWSRFMVVKAGG